MTEPKPDGFDWVKARAECSVFSVFEALRRRVKDDVARRNDGLTMEERQRGMAFTFKADGNEYFVVIAERQKRLVRFFLRDDTIEVDSDRPKIGLRATITLTNDGDCRLRVDDKPEVLQVWQVARMALEELFFGV